MTHDELVEKMLQAAIERGATRVPGPLATGAMAAALNVAMEELLRNIEPSADEWRIVCEWEPSRSVFVATFAGVNDLLASRRFRYLKPKTPEERVTVGEPEPLNSANWCVFLDGKEEIRLSSKYRCETYRLGLIAQLKEQANV